MTLSLTVLGCDGGYPGPGGAGSGYLVQAGGRSLLLDLGPGCLARLQEEMALDDLDGVVITHEHPDHRQDLEGLAVALHFAERPRRVPVLAPRGVGDLMYFREWEELQWVDVADQDQLELAGMRLGFSRTDHGPETLAVLVEADGVRLGYSADTGPGWSIGQLGPGLDLALCEATWTSSQEGRAQHLSGRQAGAMAREAGARALLITHRWPTIPTAEVAQEATQAFGRPVLTATPRLRQQVHGTGI
ncbi:MAG: MBL fold metallo-hydrolase [Candidatus Dormibacteria bacterium]